MNINTWQQGHFIDSKKYITWTPEHKEQVEKNEQLKVRPNPTGNTICVCSLPEDAKWIAKRLNLAADLEELSYNFATGKSNGEDIINYVNKKIKEVLN